MRIETVIGTITKDNIHSRNKKKELFGGAPWFAVEIAEELEIPVRIVTNVGKDFPLDKIPDNILRLSKISIVGEQTTSLDIFASEKNVPAIVRSFTGEIKDIESLTGHLAIISPLFQETNPSSIMKLREQFDTIILDIQGFTRPPFTENMRLSDGIKTHPENLPELLKAIDILKCSDNELEAMFRGQPTQSKLKNLHNLGIKSIIVTKGKEGCILSKNSVTTEFRAKSVPNANIVGAGDKFIILVGIFLLYNNSLEKSIELAQRKLEKMMEKTL